MKTREKRKPGRPAGPRKLALMEKELTYLGDMCHKCGSLERYSSSGSCAGCHGRGGDPLAREARRISREARYLAEYRGLLRYTGHSCPRCGMQERYTSTGGCVTCLKGGVVSARVKRADKLYSDTSLILWVTEAPAPELAHLYAMCPALAAYGGNIHAVYSGATHLNTTGFRLFTGADVFSRPQLLSWLGNEALMGATQEHHTAVRYLMPAINEATRMRNLGVKR